MRIAYILGPDGAGQTVGRLIHLRCHLVWFVKRYRTNHRAEDFFVDYFHPRTRSGKNCRFHKIATVTDSVAAYHRLNPVGFPGFQETEHPVQLLFGHERPHLGFRVETLSKFNAFGAFRDTIHDLVEDFILHIKP